jgi:hypothetical protein
MAPKRRIAGIAVVAGLTAACAPASADTSAGTSRDHVTRPSAAVHHSRHADAVKEAKRLIRRSPTTAGETAVASAPRKILRSAPTRPFGHTVVARTRFWTSTRSAKAVFNALKQTPPRGMRLESEGSEGDRGRVIERDVEFGVKQAPATLASADLQVKVVPTGHGNSAIGVYAEVVPQPIRHRNEHVPGSLRTVTVARIDATDNSVIKQRTITGNQARILVRDFDTLRREPPEGARSCPIQLTARQATFAAAGHTWQVEDEFCGVDAVTRDGHDLPDLVPDNAFTRALKAALR